MVVECVMISITPTGTRAEASLNMPSEAVADIDRSISIDVYFSTTHRNKGHVLIVRSITIDIGSSFTYVVTYPLPCLDSTSRSSTAGRSTSSRPSSGDGNVTSP